jgi:hypothetical protein
MDALDRLIKSFDQLDGAAQAGIFDDEENATKALFAEMGTVNAPARPFMSMTAATSEDATVRAVRDSVGETVDAAGGSGRTMDAAKDGADLLAEAMRRTIDGGVPPPNAPSTIAKKGSSRTLVDTGAMRKAIRSRKENG